MSEELLLDDDKQDIQDDQNVDDGQQGGQDDKPQLPEWRLSLPDEIRSHPILDKFKSPEDVIKSYIEAQKFLGREKIPLPPKDATKEDWDVVFNALGRPESPDGYELPEVELPEDVEIDEEFLAEFKEKAHELGLNKTQVGEFYKWYMDKMGGMLAEMEELQAERRAEAEAQLRKEWGAKYEENLKKAQSVLKNFADEDVLTEIEASGLGNNPALIKIFAKIGQSLSEDALEGKSAGRFTMTPEEAKKEILRIKSDPNHPINDEFHPEHKQALEYIESLYKMAYPS